MSDSPQLRSEKLSYIRILQLRILLQMLPLDVYKRQMLHWWIAQNTDNINDYLTSYPNAPRADEIRSLQTPVTTQDNRSIYNIFLKQFSNRKEGYWPDLLVDQFINGYYPKENAGTNDPGFDGPDLIQKGPDPNGGFFYTVFGTEILTTRHLYDLSLIHILLQCADLICDLLTKAEICSFHAVSCVTLKIILFLLDQEIDSVQSNTTVVADDTSTSVRCV